MKILHIVGARPNFMKLAPVYRAIRRCDGLEQFIVNTGQHYDIEMSDLFFKQLDIPSPDVELDVGSASHAVQTAQIMMRLEPVLRKYEPSWTIVYGDVNSTIASALVAVKLGFRFAHVEAGLRSHDWSMPEEINRILTDRIADLLFTPSIEAGSNLKNEGVQDEKIVFVGNVMIDTLMFAREQASNYDISKVIEMELEEYILVTLHRPSNVDSATRLRTIMRELSRVAKVCPVVFPVHPRTKQRLRAIENEFSTSIRLLKPVGYIEMVALMMKARAILTDSGGVQEESSVLGIPCVTLRPNTERPITIERGTNILDPDPRSAVDKLFEPRTVEAMRVAGWDGHAAERIAAELLKRL